MIVAFAVLISLHISDAADVYYTPWAALDDPLAYPQKLNGIDPARLAVYSAVAGGAWLTCDGGRKQVAPNRVNDNYCDCLDDGLDEPSTSACSRSPHAPLFW